MRKLFAAAAVLAAPLFIGGCETIKAGVAHVEEAVKTPPQTVIQAFHVLLNFGGGLLGALFQFLFHTLLPF